MSRAVAFLRGINLGGRRVKMDRLRGHFEELGLEGVASFLASGNLVFDDPDAGADRAGLEREIEGHLEEALGYPVNTFVRYLPELGELIRRPALGEARDDGFTPHVIFLRGEADDGTRERLDALATDDDRFLVPGRDVVWLRRGGLKQATISMNDLEAALGDVEQTMRNLNTVERIVGKFAG